MAGVTPAKQHLFEARSITHLYGPVAALRDVSFTVEGGHVHALLGENGCGKSTLIKIMSGAQRPSAGTLLIDEQEVHLGRASSAQSRGIAVVHQNYHLFPDMTVLENIVAGNAHAPRSKALLGGVSRRKQEFIVRGLLEQLHIDLNLNSQASLLDPAERKFVEVARAMMRSPRFLFLDEPTASLEPQSARRVLDLVQVLASQRVGIAFVSHRLDEIVSICDQFTVLRDARQVAHGSTENITEADLVRLMVGDLHDVVDNRGSSAETTSNAIEIRDCVTGPGKRAFDLDVPQGRVMALTGLVGSGASDVVQMLGGSKPFRGSLLLEGVRRRVKNPRDALRCSIGYAPEDRKGAGLIVDHPIDVNISYSSLNKVSRLGVISWKKVSSIGDEYREKLSIRTPSVHSLVSSLSGGNQQKVMLAKLFNSGVATLVLEEPTQGVDVRGRAQIHALLRAFANSGGTVVIASTDVREVASVSDQVAIFRHGELVEILNTSSIREGTGGSALQDYLVGVMESGVSATPHDLVHPDDGRVTRLEQEEAGK